VALSGATATLTSMSGAWSIWSLAATPAAVQMRSAPMPFTLPVAQTETVCSVQAGLSCMGWLRAPICYLDDYAHRWFPWTFAGHWADRVDQPQEPWICRLHSQMAERYWEARM
jgi:hypothetical protein